MESVMQDELEHALASLSKKEAQILRYRFGLSGTKSMSLKEVGDKFNLTKERIRQIEKKAIRRLQSSDYVERLEAFVA
jgi:RNA polymerase primary sigma factor